MSVYIGTNLGIILDQAAHIVDEVPLLFVRDQVFEGRHTAIGEAVIDYSEQVGVGM